MPQEMIERVRTWLGWSPADGPGRLETIATIGDPPVPFMPPTGERARELMTRLVVPRQVIDEIIDATPTAERHPEAWWLLERFHHALTDLDGEPHAPPWPAPVPSVDPLTRYFHLYAFLAAVESVLSLHAARGIPTSVTWDTLGDLGLQVAHYMSRHGETGFDGAFWLWQHFRGDIYRLGRLQYDFRHIDFEPDDLFPTDVRRGDRVLGVHIPALGPLTPAACAGSLRRARRFFPQHFPERPVRIATCTSWLMDDQLTHYLPGTSNIVRFQQRFSLVDGSSRTGDEDVMRFVFGYVPASVDDLPQRSTLERAIAQHLRDGGHWRIRVGWFAL